MKNLSKYFLAIIWSKQNEIKRGPALTPLALLIYIFFSVFFFLNYN